MPFQRHRYPPNWNEISHHIRHVRAAGRCECHGICGTDHDGRCPSINYAPHPVTGSIVILTTAHYPDPDPANCNYDNLLALCQRCHNKLDLPMRKLAAAITRRNKRIASGQMEMILPDISKP